MEMKDYFFTYTIRPVWYTMLPKAQLRFTKDDLLDLMAPFKSTIVVELTEDLNVHYHAKVALDKEGLKRLLLRCKNKQWAKKFGRKDFGPVRDQDHTNAYLKKDNMKMLIDYDINAVLKDDYGIIDPEIIRQIKGVRAPLSEAKNDSYTTNEVIQIKKVIKSTIYDLETIDLELDKGINPIEDQIV